MRIVSDNTVSAPTTGVLSVPPSLKNHPSPLGHVPLSIPAPGQAVDSEEDERNSDEDNDSSKASKYSVAESSDSD